MQTRSIIAAAILLSGLVTPARAGTWEDLGAAWSNIVGTDDSSASASASEIASPGSVRLSAGPVADGEAAYQRGDYGSALRSWLPLADQGNAEAQFDLGILYANGRGVPQDYVTAHMWFNLSASKGDKTAASYRDQIASSMDRAQLAEAQKLAREWLPVGMRNAAPPTKKPTATTGKKPPNKRSVSALQPQ
jgi:hypothetical protein